MNRSKRFSAEVEARVWEAVSDLQFTPNPVARSMITGKTHTIGVAILDIANPYFASVVKGAGQKAREEGYTVVLGDADESPERESILLTELSKRTDGIVLAGSRLQDEVIIKLGAKKPLVVVGRVPGKDVTSVVSNEYEVSFQLTKHLISTGRKKIAYLSGPAFWPNEQRFKGWRDALKGTGLQTKVFQLRAPNMDGGADIAGEVLLGEKSFDGVLAYNDLAALGFINAAKTMGLRVPESVGVAGFGDIPFAELFNPPLTTASVPGQELGRIAVEQLIMRLAGGIAPSSPVLLRSKLMIRNST